jgi:CubicO group peptidase (beta-lactamase class C family)
MKSSLPSESTAYGFNVLTLADGSNLYLKIGETAGHTSMMVWSPQKSIGIVILTNRGYLGSLKQTALDLFDSVSN